MKSWAMPMASWPRADSFSDRAICSSHRRCSVTSRTIRRSPVSSRPPHGMGEQVAVRSCAGRSPSWRRSTTVRLPRGAVSTGSSWTIAAGRHRVAQELASRFVGRPAERPLGRGIPGDDPPRRVDRHDRLGRRLDEVLQEGLGLRELAVEVGVPHDERDRLREHAQEVALAGIELAAGFDDEGAQPAALRHQREHGPPAHLGPHRLDRIEEHLHALVARALLEVLGDRGERPVERGIHQHGRGDLSQDLALDRPQRLLDRLPGACRQERRRPHRRHHQVRHGPEGREVQGREAGRSPMVEGDVSRDPGQPLVDDRHDDHGLEAECVKLGRPGKEPGQPGSGLDGLPHRG